MIKICDSAIVKPLSMIYKSCISCDEFPDIWKKSNIFPYKPMYTALALGLHSCMLLLPEVDIESCLEK